MRRCKHAESRLRQGKPLAPPRTLPFRAIAKSCESCGDLRTTPDHLLHRQAGEIPRCRSCDLEQHRQYDMRHAAWRIPARMKQDARKNAASLDLAERHRSEWTSAEMSVLFSSDVATVAAQVGRTVWAVRAMRSRVKSGAVRA